MLSLDDLLSLKCVGRGDLYFEAASHSRRYDLGFEYLLTRIRLLDWATYVRQSP